MSDSTTAIPDNRDEAVTERQPLATTCTTCGGRGRLACPGPTKAKTKAERDAGRMTVDWCYGMHMGHECPDCGAASGRSDDE